MKKRTLASFAAAALFGFLALPMFSPLSANEGAGVYKDWTCRLFDGNNALVFGDDSLAVVTSNGNRTVKCWAAGVANPTGMAVRRSGFNCNAFGVFTTDTMSTVSAGGHSTLTCLVRK